MFCAWQSTRTTGSEDRRRLFATLAGAQSWRIRYEPRYSPGCSRRCSDLPAGASKYTVVAHLPSRAAHHRSGSAYTRRDHSKNRDMAGQSASTDRIYPGEEQPAERSVVVIAPGEVQARSHIEPHPVEVIVPVVARPGLRLESRRQVSHQPLRVVQVSLFHVAAIVHQGDRVAGDVLQGIEVFRLGNTGARVNVPDAEGEAMRSLPS
jgi:hypothetical protein